MTANELLRNDIYAELVPNDTSATMHVGGSVDPAGGTLVYNNRPTKIRQLVISQDGGGGVLTLGGQSGPLHDPTALLYVMQDDLEPIPALQGSKKCHSNRQTPGVIRASCQARLKVDAPVEPVVLRAAAGDCIKVTLYNKLPTVAPDLAGYNTLLQVVNRDRLDPQGLTTFNNNLIRPSSHVGLHPQLVEYDITRSDGANVGINQVQTAAAVSADSTSIPRQVYTWYAGDLSARAATDADMPPCKKGKGCSGAGGNDLFLVATPIEFGGFNLNPADKIKQGQKGLIGAGTIEPEGATWPTSLASLDTVMDHQVLGTGATRKSRTSTTVTYPGGDFRDTAVVIQKGLNHRFGDGSAVPSRCGSAMVCLPTPRSRSLDWVVYKTRIKPTAINVVTMAALRPPRIAMWVTLSRRYSPPHPARV